jgi:hypothetical protein
MPAHDFAPRVAHVKWLPDSVPSIRWQVMRDLSDADPEAIAAQRSRVATEGWGVAFQNLTTGFRVTESGVCVASGRICCAPDERQPKHDNFLSLYISGPGKPF